MSIQHTRMRFGAAPALMAHDGSAAEAGVRGAILFFHGFTAAKEGNLKELNSLASRGWLAVGLDNVGHGERRYPDFERRFSSDGGRVDSEFLEVVHATSREVPGILDTLIAGGLARPGRLGIAGISMGGYITYSALLEDRRLQVAAPILGSPRWWANHPASPHLRPGGFFPAALLSQTAGEDESVPPRMAREFHRQLEPYYTAAPERLSYVEFAGAGHFMPEADWNRLWSNVLDWFGRHLATE